MSYQSSYGNDEEDFLLESGIVAKTEEAPTQKTGNKWAFVAFGTAFVVFAVLIINSASKSNNKTVYVEPSIKSQANGDTVVASTTSSHSSLVKKFKKAIMTNYSKLSDTEHQSMFKVFTSKHNKKYETTTEETERFNHFKAFLKVVDERNAAEVANNGFAIHDVTKFADLSPPEFKARYTNFIPPTTESKVKAAGVEGTVKKEVHFVEKYSGTSTVVDWSDTLTTGIRDQGYCGSCWAFSATEQIETDAIRAGYLTPSDKLSPQQIVSCDKIDYGCGGGNTETAYIYVARNGGLVPEGIYPYTSYWAETGTCSYSSSSASMSLSGYKTIHGESSIIDYVLSSGPLSICLDASTWSSYSGGIVTTCGKEIDHCVQVVGVNTDDGYYKVRNSWGTSWGDDGYIYLATGSDMCGLTYDPTFVTPVKV